MIGSVLDADKGISVRTDIGDIQILAAKETTETYSYEQTIRVSIGDALKTLTRPDELVQSDNGQLRLNLASASYDMVDFASTESSHKASELTAGAGIRLDSVADVVIEGSAIDAVGAVNLLAGGDVVIREAKDSYSETLEEVHGKADISLVVQHQAVEVAKAAKAVDDAKDQVKQAEADYRQYQKQKDQLASTLAQLEADYAAGVPGVSHGDIVELRNLLDDVNGDEAWYLAGIATASANLVSKTTLLVQQTAAAAQSSATYGFNAGLQLDIEASKTDSSLDATSSLASTVSGSDITIVTGGDGQSGTTLIQGSALNANQSLNIFTGELNVLASQDSMRSETDTQSGTMTIAQTFWGAAGGPTMNASLNSSQQQDRQTTHTNSSLTADNLNIVTTGDANITGGNLHGSTAVTMDIGGDLTLESVQDRFSGSSKGFGISGGMSLGGVYTNENGANANSKEAKTTALGQSDGASGVSGGLNASSGRYQSTETVLSSITGGTVSIDVTGHTQLTGALIAALDAEGNDTGNLSLSTGSLSFTDLSNRSYSSNQSLGVNASMGIGGKENPADPNQTNINSSTYSYQNESSQSLDNTLATIGQGSITVGGEATEPAGLNRDVDAINKEIYAVDRQQGNIDLTLDHRLLSEEGRKQIAEDVDEIRQKGQVVYILLTEDASTSRDIKITAIDEVGMSWGEAKELVNREDVQAVAEAADRFGDALSGTVISDEPLIFMPPAETTDPDGALEIVITDGRTVDSVLHNVVDVAGDVAQKLEQVDPRVVAVVELGLAAAGGVKSAVQLVVEKVIAETPVGEAFAEFIQKAGLLVSDVATNYDAADREWAEGFEGTQQYVEHMDKGGTLLAGVALGTAGSGGIAAAIKNVGSSKTPSLPGGYTRNSDGSINGPGGGRAMDTGHPAPDGSPIYQRQGEGGSGSYYWVDKDGIQQPIESPRPQTNIGEQYAHHRDIANQTTEGLRAQGFDVQAEVRMFSSCGSTYCKPDIVYRNADGQVGFIEVKTGNAGLSTNQAAIFQRVGENNYIIPGDRVLSPQAAAALDVKYKPGLTVADAGYPNGIPAIIQRERGLGD